MRRDPHEKSMGLDLSKPLDLSVVKVDDGTCFGKMWDPRENDCQICADRDICCAVKEMLVVKGRSAELDAGAPKRLDRARMHLVTDEMISAFIRKHKKSMSSSTLIEEVMRMGNTDDRPSAIERLKRYKSTGLIKIVQGVVQWLG